MSDLLRNIEVMYFPALEMSRDLQDLLGMVEQGFEDSVSISDEMMLQENDDLRDAFMGIIQAGKMNTVVDQSELNSIGIQFEDYYSLAYGTTSELITGNLDADMLENIKKISKMSHSIRSELKEGAKNRQEKMTRIFNEARTEYQTGMLIFLLVTCIALVVMGGVSIWMIRSLSKPLGKIMDAAKAIAQGDLTQEVPVLSDDELGQLASSFNIMVGGFRNLMKGIRDAGLQINVSASEIDQGARQQAAGAAEQSTTVTEISVTMEELSQTAGRIAENAQDLAKSAEETLVGMKGIKTNVDQVARKILALGEKSQSIGNITKLIDDMSDRINLLALNAAIEAARAGEAGRGFAVVAAEVGKLAERSVESTSDIRQLIGEIQSEMNSTIMGVEETTKWTNKGLEMVGDTAQVIKEISVATQQQKSAAEQVVEAMNDIDRVTTSFASTTGQTAASANKLTELSTQLKSDISGFKMDKGGLGFKPED